MTLKARLGFYGKVVRKLRVDKGMKLCEMADAINMSSAFLSAIEKGDKQVPKTLIEKVVQALGLEPGGQEQRNMEEAVMLDRGYITVDISQASPQAQDVAVRFAQSLDSLDDGQLDAVMAIVNKSARRRNRNNAHAQ